MTSLNKNEMPGTANRVKKCALFELLPENTLECCGPVEWSVSQIFRHRKGGGRVHILRRKRRRRLRYYHNRREGVKESLGFRLMLVRIFSASFGNDTPREWVLPQEIGRIYQPRGLGPRPEWG
jgi:hypothetical protein